MPFKLLCLILFTVSIVACSSLPEKTVTQTAPAVTFSFADKNSQLAHAASHGNPNAYRYTCSHGVPSVFYRH